MNRTALVAISAFVLNVSALHAQIPQLINYQGRVVVGTTNFNGTGQFKFALVNANGSTTYWSNDGTSSAGSQPTNAVSLTVSKGLYSLLLGDTSVAGMTVAIPVSVFNNTDVRLRVWFNDGTNGTQLLAPDQRIASIGYAAMAANIVDGAITAAKIANGAVGSAQISNGGVGSSQIASNAVGSSQIANGAVSSAKIANGAITNTQIDPTTVQRRVTGTAPAGSFLSGINADGSVAFGTGIWSLNGANTYYNGGRVGIGTSTPVGALDVRGTLVLEAGGSPGLYTSALAGEQNRFLSLINSPTTQTASGLKAGGLLVSDDYFYANPGKNDLIVKGNIGIGTAAPAVKLEVLGSGIIESEITSTDDRAIVTLNSTMGGANRVWTIENGLFGNAGFFGIYDRTAGKARLAIDTNGTVSLPGPGNVGIGTTGPPAAKLEVAGSGTTESMVTSVGDRAIVSLNSTIATTNRVWTIENGLFGNAGFFGIYDRTAGKARLTIDTNGTVSVPVLSITGGADVAEPFQMGDEELEKGAVVVIDNEHPGRLKRSRTAYDKRVAGIISGANGVNPGIALHQDGSLEGGQNVALSGRVYVEADTSGGPIEAGDFLTTSDTPGRAMKVTDYGRAQGAVIGKAMSALSEGEGKVLVLVSLQ